MKIEIIRGVVVCGEATQAGQIVDAPERLAAQLIAKGKAREVVAKAADKDDTKPASRVSDKPARKVGSKPSESNQSKKES